MNCKANGKGWACDRTNIIALGLCPGHYAQHRQERPLAPLRGAHGAKIDGEAVTVKVRLPKAAALVLEAEASRLGVPAAEVYRAAVEGYAERLLNGTAIVLSPGEFDRVADLIAKPPKPNAALRRAMRGK